jgi:hypothetical protein
MDDQSADRESSKRVKRFRYGVRLMLVTTALIATLSAWAATARNAKRAQLRAEIQQIEMMRKSPTDNDRERRRMFTEIDAEVAKRRALLGE